MMILVHTVLHIRNFKHLFETFSFCRERASCHKYCDERKITKFNPSADKHTTCLQVNLLNIQGYYLEEHLN